MSPIATIFFASFPDFPKHFEGQCRTLGSWDQCMWNRAAPVARGGAGLNHPMWCGICWQLGTHS